MSQQPPQPQRDEEQYLGLTGGQLNAAFLGVVGVIVAGVCGWLFLLDGIDTVTGKKETDQRAFVEQRAANLAILTLADLPEGWKARAAGDSDSDFQYQFSERCQFLEQDVFAGELASADSDDLYGPSGLTVNSDASVFSADSAATDAFGTFNDALSCKDELVAAMTQLLNQSLVEDGVDPATGQVSVSFDQVPAPAIADAAVMYRLVAGMQASDRAISFTIDILAFRHGRMAGQLVYTAIDSTPSPEEEQQLAGLAAAKLVAAEVSLPDA